MTSRSRPKVSLSNIPKRPQIGPDTRFYIDYTWWEESGKSIESYLNTRLGHEISLDSEARPIDLIDTTTGEVRQLSGFEYAVQRYFNELSADYAQRASLVDAVFCVLLGNGNLPMSATEIAEKIQRAPSVVYRTLGSPKIYQGIRIYRD